MCISKGVYQSTAKIAVLVSVFLFSGNILAQSASQLADRVDQKNSEWLQQIDRIQITNKTTAGMLEGMESTTAYEKVNRDGIYILEAIDEDLDYDLGEMTGYFDGSMGKFIRNSESIDEDTYDGRSVYRVHVSDGEFLQSLGGPEQLAEDELEDEFYTESATAWIDRDELLLYRISFDMRGQGDRNMTIHIRFSEYQDHAGLPIPHVMDFDIEGLDQMISEEDLEEARRGMRELEQQLEQMPEAQRQMIEEQLQPQFERFEQMLEQGELGEMRIEVMDVQVN